MRKANGEMMEIRASGDMVKQRQKKKPVAPKRKRFIPPPPPGPPPDPRRLRQAGRNLFLQPLNSQRSGLASFGNNDYSPEGNSSLVLEPYRAALDFASALDHPWSAVSGSARLIDPLQTIASEAAKHSETTNVTVHNGATAADGSIAFILRGDTKDTIFFPASIDAGSTVTWAGGTGRNTYGTYSSGFYVRPVVTFVKLHVYQTGDAHPISLMSMRLMPAVVATQYGVAIDKTSSGPSQLEKDLLGGTETVLNPESEASFRSHASRGTADYYSWTTVGADRGASSFAAYCIWAYGLRSTDRVEIEYGSHAEYMPNATVPTPLHPDSIGAVMSNSAAADVSMALADTMVATGKDQRVSNAPAADGDSKGISQVKSIITNEKVADTVDNAVEAVMDVVSGNFWGAAVNVFKGISRWFTAELLLSPVRIRTTDGEHVMLPPLIARYTTLPNGLQEYAQAYRRAIMRPALVARHPDEELKEDDFHSIDRPVSTPITGRDSSSSSSASKAPPSGGRRP